MQPASSRTRTPTSPEAMRRLLFAFVAAAAAALVQAQPADLLHSKECKAARVELDAALDEAAKAKSRGKRLDAARSAAADACFGKPGAKAERSGAPDPVRTVPPPAIAAPQRPAPPVASIPAPSPPPAVSIARPATITACDPAGCWDSEGRRLNQQGTVFVGPRGPCILAGGAVSCP